MNYTNYYFILLLIFSSCSSLKKPVISDVNNISYVSSDKETISINFDIHIKNPNSFSIGLKEVEFEIKSDSIVIGNGSTIQPISIEKKSTTVMSLNLSIYKDEISVDYIKSVDDIKLHLSVIPKYFPFKINKVTNLKIDGLIDMLASNVLNNFDLEISKLKVNKIGLKETLLDVYFDINNNSNFNCEIDNLVLKFYESSELKNILAKSKNRKSILIKANQTTSSQTSFKINSLSMSSVLMSNTLQNNNSLFVVISSDIVSQDFSFPITVTKELVYNPLNLEFRLK